MEIEGPPPTPPPPPPPAPLAASLPPLPDEAPSVITAFTEAIDRAFDLLFPLSFKRWATFSLAVWVAGLSSFLVAATSFFGGVGFFSGSLPGIGLIAGATSDGGEVLSDYMLNNEFGRAFFMVWGGSSLVICMMAFLAFWAAARGKLILLHNTVSPKDAFVQPWDDYAREANSLFRLYLGLFICIFIPTSLYFAYGWLRLVRAAAGDASLVQIGTDYALTLAAELITIAPFVLGSVIFLSITNDFVLPIMYKRRVGWLSGWSIFLPILAANVGTFAFYFVVRLVCFFVIQFVVQSVYGMLACLCCFPYIPVVNRAPFIALDLFSRSFPLLLLGKLVPEFDMLEDLKGKGTDGVLPSMPAAPPAP